MHVLSHIFLQSTASPPARTERCVRASKTSTDASAEQLGTRGQSCQDAGLLFRNVFLDVTALAYVRI